MIVVFSAGWQDRYRRLVRHLDEQQFRIQDGCLVLADGRLPKVRDITDPVLLGVHQAAASTIVARDGQAVSGPPAYVPRDVDAELREHLTRAGFVLLVGDSTAGKSRAAFEAVSATLSGHVLIRPSGREAVAAAVDRAARERRCVLWLDDLEGYLGTGGLPAAQLGRLLRGEGHHRVIVATIRPAEQARITANAAGDDAGRQASRDIRQVLDQAHPIRVARMFTGDELKRARTRCWDPRIAEAIDHAATYGIAEYLTAGPELLRMWEDARATDGQNARGAALVAAAIDIRRAGYTFPIPRALLDHVHEQYLADPEDAQAPREPATSAWDWATTCPHWATTPLLRPAGPDLVEVFEYLVDTVQRRVGPLGPVPEPVVRAAIDSASPVDSDSLAATAYAQGRYSLAEHAWRKTYHAKASDPAIGPDHPDTLDSRSNLARVLATRADRARLEEAEAEYRAVLEARTRVLGPDHPDTLDSRGNLARVLAARADRADRARLEEAEAEYRAVLDGRTRVLGPDHPDTLDSRSDLARVLATRADPARLEEAEAEYRAAVEGRTRVLGPDHADTLDSRSNLALVLADRGRLEEAEAEYRAVLEARTRVLGPDHADTLDTRSNLARVLAARGRLEEAEAEYHTVLEARTRVLLPDRPAPRTAAATSPTTGPAGPTGPTGHG